MNKFDMSSISSVMNGVLKRQILISLMLLLVSIIAVIIGFLCFRVLFKTSKIKALSILILPIICFMVLLILRYNIVKSCYLDYKNSSYIILQDNDYYIKFGNIGVLETVHSLTTEYNQKKVNLKIEEYQKSFLNTGNYTGTIVFAERSKYVLIYELLPSGDAPAY